MTTPFINDMFSVVYKAFKNLYPDKKCEIQWVPDNFKENDEECYGCTDFQDDGTVLVCVSALIPVKDAVEVLAHELAHVAVGIANEHNKQWEDAFEAIFVEYNRLSEKLFM